MGSQNVITPLPNEYDCTVEVGGLQKMFEFIMRDAITKSAKTAGLNTYLTYYSVSRRLNVSILYICICFWKPLKIISIC